MSSQSNNPAAYPLRNQAPSSKYYPPQPEESSRIEEEDDQQSSLSDDTSSNASLSQSEPASIKKKGPRQNYDSMAIE